jgi:hypothetical protein
VPPGLAALAYQAVVEYPLERVGRGRYPRTGEAPITTYLPALRYSLVISALSSNALCEDAMKNLMRVSAIALIAIAGCATTTRVRSSAAPGANLSGYRTYAFYTEPYQQKWPAKMVEERVRSAIAQDLEQKGLVPATSGPPDVLIGYHMKKRDVPDYSAANYPSDCCGFIPVTTYPEGTLVVDFIDPQTRAVVWRGSATRCLKDRPDLSKVDDAVAKLIGQYPAQLAAAPRPRL